ncbi:DUF3549 family protein [Catenovulum sp. 2E275]|uniref:DUF3549 family protein n=1 Tax=Catenovulum sp. 2E275 TaxID=2980497 RepID=UPI0021CFFAFA|nr:DUF3549 family protein [Catenovulum sp. 2E275]MCU4676959.1 DUF3549 family protein [Catenovulum sp. 2E275]
MDTISTLYQLVQAAGCDYCIYDIGRRVTEISKTEFEQFENTQIPYPYPIQKTARFALVYWPLGQTNNPYIWFMNLPLNEESQVILASRNHFVAIIQEAMGGQITQGSEDKLPDNPYIKAPDAKKLAVVNAKLKQKLKLPPSKYLADCISYLSHQNWDNWQNLAIQGWADLLVRLNDPKVNQLFDDGFFEFPAEMKTELASLIEHEQLSRAAYRRIVRQLQNKDLDKTEQVTLLRCLAGFSDDAEFNQYLTELLSQEQTLDADLLAVISARCFAALGDPLLLSLYLEKIAAYPTDGLFEALFTDLVAIPNIRRCIFALLQNPNALPKTREALSKMVAGKYNAAH